MIIGLYWRLMPNGAALSGADIAQCHLALTGPTGTRRNSASSARVTP